MKRSWVQVDLDALADNIKAVRDGLSDDTEIMFVVKANAYGHGAVPVAQKASECGVKWFTVAYLHEALQVRQALSEPDILILGVVEPQDAALLMEERMTPIVADLEHAHALSDAAQQAGGRLRVHVKIDTGMGRLGIPWRQGVEQLLEICALPGLDVHGVCSHFAKVEPRDPQDAEDQAERFFAVVNDVEKQLGRSFFRHLSSSRALLYHQEWDLNGVRPGIMLYGYGTRDPAMRMHTKPLLQWRAYVMQVKHMEPGDRVGYYGTHRVMRPTEVATLCVGYADGYLRLLSNRGSVLIQGRRCPVIGRVSMNWLNVDVGPNSGVQRGDEAVLLGEQGDEMVWGDELGRLCRTIPYEILTCIDANIERQYLDSGKVS